MRLVLLDGQHELATPADDLGGDVFLTAHGIDGHHGPFEVQELEQLGDGRNLVGFGVRGHLAEGQVILHRPGADDVQGRLTDGARRAEPRSHLPSMAAGLSSGGSRGTGVKPRRFITAVIQA